MLVVPAQAAAERQKMKYLVTASEGPGWSTPEEALKVLEKGPHSAGLHSILMIDKLYLT
jgi:hypothetical protein